MLPILASSTAVARVTKDSLVGAFLAGRSPRTLRAYAQDLEDFAGFAGAVTVDAAARLLLERSQGEANGMTLAYRANLLDRGLAPATVNRRLAALRSLVTLARTLGLASFALEVPGVKGEKYRDTRGPGADGVRHLLGLLRAKRTPRRAAIGP